MTYVQRRHYTYNDTLPKGYIMKCPICNENINKDTMEELSEYFTYNKDYNCQVCKDCNRDHKLNELLNE